MVIESRSKSTEMRFLKCVCLHLMKTGDLQEFIDFSTNSVIILLPSIQLFLYFWIETSWQRLMQNVCHYEAVILRSYK
jgi:fumarate reductase subunit C